MSPHALYKTKANNMKTRLFKKKKTSKSSLSTFKMKAQAEQESLDTLISGLMGNCHDDFVIDLSTSGPTIICLCEDGDST